ncbi:TPR and ankyrin repeat-containing protein 1 [Desmophyllum pertusum]|uniref:TPR and ankyrin repeat-containing protein 1 n=1 Tax=Desmophyllum pertusum TaxID=174260 RepID=A0A9W9YZV7_9CNID|nr:TPR and ankyrin repeat-containing protein 1 [Desmophyllum pertusum]
MVIRFLTLTAKRSGMIYPSIANTVMILEHQLTACLALYTRLCADHRYPICLPASYLTIVRFWDTFRPGVEDGTMTMYQAIDHHARHERDKVSLLKDLDSVLSHMTRLTCGKEALLFDVLGDAIDSEDTGEAERALVLVLTMLCNCGKGISIFLDEVILENIFKVKPNPSLPIRIIKVLEEIQEAKGFSDVVTTLKRFLECRGEELYDLRWNKGQLWYDGSSNPSRYAQKFRIDVSNIREELKRGHQQEEASKDRETISAEEDENADVLDAAGESMVIEYSEKELKKKEKAQLEVSVIMMQKLYRRKKFVEKISLLARVLRARKLRRLESIEQQTMSPSSVLEEHFAPFRVDSSACGICGTNFKGSTDENLPMSHEENEGR